VLLDTWHPVTHDFGIIQAPVDKAMEALVNWHGSIGIAYARRTANSFEEALGALAPLSAENRRSALVPTAAGWTAYFQSGISGSDPFPAMSFLAQKMGVLAMRVCATHSSAKWPAVIWEVYAPPSLGGNETNGLRRAISAANDGGRWNFYSSGTPFEFEDLAAYARPKKRDRFTKALLEQYLANFGLFVFEQSFYTASLSTPAVVLEKTRRWTHPAEEFSLDEVIDGLPWKRPDTAPGARNP